MVYPVVYTYANLMLGKDSRPNLRINSLQDATNR